MFKKQIWLHEHEYRAMTPKVAKEYFDWFKENIPNELETLRKVVKKSISLDYTPESLNLIYDWFLSVRTYIKLTKKQILEDYASAPDFILQEMLENRYVPTVQTTEIAAMIAIYFGEVFIRNDSDLYWDYVKKPKSDVCFNEPVVYGFTPPDQKPCYVSTFNWCIPLYSNTRKGTNWDKTWYEYYLLWIENKATFYAPDFCSEKYIQKILEQNEQRAGNEKVN